MGSPENATDQGRKPDGTGSERHLPLFQRRRFRIALLIATAIALIVAAGRMSTIFTPVMIALALAYILDPVITWMQHKGIRRWVGVTIVYIVMLGVIALGIVFFVPKIVQQSRKLYQTLTAKAQQYGLNTWVEDVIRGPAATEPGGIELPGRPAGADASTPEPAAPEPAGEPPSTEAGAAASSGGEQEDQEAPTAAPDETRQGEEAAPESRDEKAKAGAVDGEYFRQVVREHAGRIAVKATSLFYQAVMQALQSLSNIVTFFVSTFLVFIYAFFFMLHFKGMKDVIKSYLPAAQRSQILRILGEIDRAVASFFRGRVIVSLISSVVTATGLYISGIDYWLLLGIATGFLGYIPFIGVLLALIPAVALAILTPHPATSLLGVGITFGLVQAAVEPLVGTKVLSKEMNLHPVTLIIALLVGGKLFGIFGAIVSVPLAAIAKILGREFLLPPLQDLADPEREPSMVRTPVGGLAAALTQTDSGPRIEPAATQEQEKAQTQGPTEIDPASRAKELIDEVREETENVPEKKKRSEKKQSKSGGDQSRDSRRSGGKSRSSRRGRGRRKPPPGVEGPIERHDEFMSDVEEREEKKQEEKEKQQEEKKQSGSKGGKKKGGGKSKRRRRPRGGSKGSKGSGGRKSKGKGSGS